MRNEGGFWRRTETPPKPPIDYAVFHPDKPPEYVRQQDLSPTAGGGPEPVPEPAPVKDHAVAALRDELGLPPETAEGDEPASTTQVAPEDQTQFNRNEAQRATLQSRVQAIEDVGSSRVDLQACKLEYSIVSPK